MRWTSVPRSNPGDESPSSLRDSGYCGVPYPQTKVWGWIIMGLGGGMLVPLFLRLYWWRFNGGGFAIGMTVGLFGAVLQRLVFPDLGELQQFGIMLAIGSCASIVGTYLSPPTDRP